MARRLLTRSALTGGESGSTVTLVGPSSLPGDTYYGFAIGSQSDHDQLLVEAGETVLVTAGAVVPIQPWTGAPKVRAVRRLLSTVQPDEAVAHIVGLTNPCELAIRPRRAPRRWTWLDATGGSGDLMFPLGGRRHVLVVAALNPALAVTISGVTIEAGEDTASAVATATLYAPGAVTGFAVNLGGTDHEELFENLHVIWAGAAGTKAFRIYAAGEVGG